MAKLEKRLEIRLDKGRFTALIKEAKRTHRSIAELIRAAIDKQYQKERILQRLLAVKKLGEVGAPVKDWHKMEREIAKGMIR